MKRLSLHRIVYKIARIILIPFLKYRFGFQFEKVTLKDKPCMVLANHVTNWDPLLVALSFPEHMYFVASEHLFRLGILSKLLNYFLAPIMRAKGRTEMRTAVNILKTIKSGNNVCMFAEGACTWNGETGMITPATAKLIKRCGTTMITYRLEGSYLTLPRWAKTLRRGKMRGYLVNEYSSDKLSKMSEEEIYQAICRDLYVNAFSDNEKTPVIYRGKRPAEYLETVLYVCPGCGKIATLKSRDDLLECTCGLSLRYNAYGFFESMTSEKAPFKTILEWDKWQRLQIQDNAEYYRNMPVDKPIVTDEDQFLYQFEAGSSTRFIGSGSLSLYSDRLVLKDSSSGESTVFQLSNITDMALIQRTLLTFTVDGKNYYEVKSRHPRSGLKYLMLCKCLTDLRIML